MIDGIHAILYTTDAPGVRSFLRDVLGLGLADPGPEWPIFLLPPAELGVHPHDGATRADLYLMTRDIHAALDALRARGVEVVGEVRDQGWGIVSGVRLPDGAELPIYQPRHPSVVDRPKA